jgi:tetratricopeptide (TPR) repeat protein
MKHFIFLIFLFSSSLHAAVDFWWQMAVHYEQAGDPALQEMSLRKVLEEEPYHADALKALKQIEENSRQKKRIDEKISDISRTLDSGEIILKQVGKSIKEFKTPEDQITFLEKRLEEKNLSTNQKESIMKTLGYLYFHRGIQDAQSERIKNAIENLEKSVYYDSSFQLTYYELGFLYFKIRELERGIANLEKFYQLQPVGSLSRSVKDTLLHKYISIARKYFFQKDFQKCKPILEKIMKFDNKSPEAKTALTYLMELYFYQGIKFMKVNDYEKASKNYFDSLMSLKAQPEFDRVFLAKLAGNAVDPFIKYGQKLFLNKNFGEAYPYFEAVSWLVPGTPQSFLAKEYMKEIGRRTGSAENPVVYFSHFIDEENKRFLQEEKRMSGVMIQE